MIKKIDRKFSRVAVLMGGDSQERDISVLSGKAVSEALKKRNYNVNNIILDKIDFKDIKEKVADLSIEAVFIALHGGAGEDGRIQNILQKLQLPYTGSGPQASLAAMNKIKTKEIFLENDITTADYMVIEKDNIDIDACRSFLPCVVKPTSEGSSVGLSIVEDEGQLADALDAAFVYSERIIAVKYIAGREITVGILDNKPLPIVEIIPHRSFYDYKAKYNDRLTRYIVPAETSVNLTKKIQGLAQKAHEALGCNYFSRVDMRLSDLNNPYVMEVNTIPGLTTHSLLPKAAEAAGYSFCDLCEKILNSACIMK
jgi:D-alanine--D-alanine ligase